MTIFNFIKKNVPILDVIQLYTSLKKAGHYWKGVCPFHSEKTASFTVSPNKEIFYCFGCHMGGDVITFMSKIEQCGQFEAAQSLADRFNLDIPKEFLVNQSHSIDGSLDEKKNYWKICQSITIWCHQQLLQNHIVIEYLTKRGIDSRSIEYFELGYFPRGTAAIKSLIVHVQQQHFLVEDLLNAGILAQNRQSFYSPFEDRIIFPITDHLGRHCAFGGRIFKLQDERAKYYNSSENQFFIKGSILFGLDRAKKNIQKEESVFLVEGYTDCIAMVQHGYYNCVATLGTACTQEHLKQLARYASVLFVLYDGDQAGHNAILRLTELCWQVNLELKVIVLPPEDDPATFLNKHKNLNELLLKAQDIFLFFIESLGRDYLSQNLNKKLNLVRKLVQTIAKISDHLKQDILLQQAASTFDIPYQTLKKELEQDTPTQESSSSRRQITHHEASSNPESSEISDLEKKLFSVIINHGMVLTQEDESYLLDYFDHRLSMLLKKRVAIVQERGHYEFVHYFNELNENEKLLVSKIAIEYQDFVAKEQFDQLLLQFQKKHWKSFVHDTKLKLAQAQQNNNEVHVNKILYDFQELKKKLLKRGLI
jgi:DNA primase